MSCFHSAKIIWKKMMSQIMKMKMLVLIVLAAVPLCLTGCRGMAVRTHYIYDTRPKDEYGIRKPALLILSFMNRPRVVREIASDTSDSGK